MASLNGWGRFPVIKTDLIHPNNLEDLCAASKQEGIIARGNGRAYGDCAVGKTTTISMKSFNRYIKFDEKNGVLVTEAGVLLDDIINTFVPRGWFPFVTPGTKYVTVGGMIATDVHGKNHHKEGGFGRFVDWIDIIGKDGEIQRCSRSENAEIFYWTLGGMGLTGIIYRACIRLRKIETAWIYQRTLVAKNLEHTLKIFEKFQNSTYSVAWIDCSRLGSSLGRSLVMLGEHAKLADLPVKRRNFPLKMQSKRNISIPFEFPNWVLNIYTVRWFNTLYYWLEN